MITLLCITACYIGSIALSFVLWACHSFAWFHRYVEPDTTEAEAKAALRRDCINSLLRGGFFALITPLIWMVAAQQHTNELIRWWHIKSILQQQK